MNLSSPSLSAIQDLVASVDVENILAEGGPADGYDIEAEQICEQLDGLSVDQLTAERIQPEIERIWVRSYDLTREQLAKRKPRLRLMATRIARFVVMENFQSA